MNKLTKRREPIFALASFGPNFLNLFFSVYIQNALLGNINNGFDVTDPKRAIVSVAIFSVLFTITKIIDALLNIPMAHLSDRTKSRWGRRRPCILIGMSGLLLTYIALCNPLTLAQGSMANTIYIFIILICYFTSYCLCLESFYASFPEITYDMQARVRLTSWKAFYDTIGYSIGYALMPMILGYLTGISMRWIGMSLAPLMLTMIIPIILIKEPGSYIISFQGNKKIKKLTKQAQEKENVGLWESIKITIIHRPFLTWVLIFALFYFGLDLFLQGQVPLAQHSMGLNSWQTTVINTAAFAPIPLMLIINKKIMNKWGFKAAFSIAIISFIIAMLSFMIAYVNWIGSVWTILIIATIGSTIGSFGLTNFFAAPYLIPTHVAKEQTDKNHKANQAMFFGVQGIVVALSNALNEPVWINVSQIGKTSGHPEYGPHIMTYIVIGVCSLALIATIVFMPKQFKNIGKLKDLKLNQHHKHVA